MRWIDTTPEPEYRGRGEESQEILELEGTSYAVAIFGWEDDPAWGVYYDQRLVRYVDGKREAMAYAEELAYGD